MFLANKKKWLIEQRDQRIIQRIEETLDTEPIVFHC